MFPKLVYRDVNKRNGFAVGNWQGTKEKGLKWKCENWKL